MQERQAGDRSREHARAGDLGETRRDDQLDPTALERPAEPAQTSGAKRVRVGAGHDVDAQLDGHARALALAAQHRDIGHFVTTGGGAHTDDAVAGLGHRGEAVDQVAHGGHVTHDEHVVAQVAGDPPPT